MNCLKSINVDLQPHAAAVVEHMSRPENRGLLIAHGPGTGKTLLSIATAQCLLAKKQVNKVIVVTPTSLVTNYQKELAKFGVVNSKAYTIKTYGMMLSKYKHLSTEDGEERPISSCKDVFLICDEAHNLRTAIGGNKGKLAKLMLKCASVAKKVLLLTATPVVNDSYDICNLMAMIQGDPRPMTRSKFEHGILSDPQQFASFFRCKTSFYSRPETDPNYPKKIEKSVFLRMSDAFYKDYHAIELQQFKKLKVASIIDSEVDVWAFLGGVRRASNAAHLENSPKIDWAIRKAMNPGKSIIYSSFLAAGKDLLIQRLIKNNISYAEVHGSLSKEDRKQALLDYNSGRAKVLLISKAGGEGLDTKNTARIILLDPTWNDASAEQIIGRAIRYKSHESLPVKDRVVRVYKLYLLKPTKNWLLGGKKWNDDALSADEMMCKLVERKTKSLKKFTTSVAMLSIEKQRCLT
jgi:SNF2 family DNA or RNA helicase